MHARTGYLVAATVLLGLFALLGVRSSLAAVGADLTTGQRAVTTLQWWYAVLAVLAIAGLLARHAGTRLVLFAWAAIFTTRNALAPVYIGGKGIALAVAGGAVGLAIAVGVLYLGFRALGTTGGPSTR
jgi:hypothetical protein